MKKLNLFRITTNKEVFHVYAETATEAEVMIINKYFPEALDDDLADLLTTEEITEKLVVEKVEEPF